MKSILMSIRPQWVAKILNGEKTIEIRKKFPKDYVGWVYIYCTKNGGMTYKYEDSKYHATSTKNYFPHYCINAKVVARFWCDKVVEYVNGAKIVCGQPAHLNTYKFILKDTCLTEDELYDYCEDLSFNAIHITKLEIFDTPKEISEFKRCTEKTCIYGKCHKYMHCLKPLTRAPQSWCYVEI